MACPNDCQGRNLNYRSEVYNTKSNNPWRIIPLRRMNRSQNGSDRFTITADGETNGVTEGPPKPESTKPEPNSGRILINSRKASETDGFVNNNEENEVGSTSQIDDNQPTSGAGSRLDRCKHVIRELRTACINSVLEEAREDHIQQNSIENGDSALLFYPASLNFK